MKTLKHALETMDSKFQVVLKESRQKDQFLQQHIVGRCKTDEQREYAT